MQRSFTLSVLFLGVSALALGSQEARNHSADAPVSGPALDVRLSEPRALEARFQGPSVRAAALRAGQLPGKALTSADFDEDGVPDLVVAHAGADGRGALSLYRGNVDSLHPNSVEAKRRRAAGTFVEAPFLPDVAVFDTPEGGDLVGAGDFDADGHRDVVVARRGGAVLWWQRGDGKGAFGEARRIAVPGPIAALAVGDVNRRDGLEDIVVAAGRGATARVLVFEGPEGALSSAPEEIAIAGAANGLAIGSIDDDGETDVVVATDSRLQVIRGRDRHLSLDAARRAAVAPPAMETIALPFQVESLTLGEFDAESGLDLALLDASCRLRIVPARKLVTASWDLLEASDIEADASCGAGGSHSMRLLGARLSARPGTDLLLIDDAGAGLVRRPDVGADAPRGFERARSLGSVQDLLPMRLRPLPLDDLVVLQSGAATPVIADPPPPGAIMVTNTNDAGPGSLRQAIETANATPDLDTIAFDMPGPGPYTIQPASPLPSIDYPITIDGTTEPDYSTTPVVRIDGFVAGTEHGLRVHGGGSLIKGLALTRFAGPDHSAIELATFGSSSVQGCLIGISSLTTAGLGNSIGIRITSTDNTIGGTTAGARNVISAQLSAGIVVTTGADRTTIRGNYIGLDVAGTGSVPNAYGIAAGSVAGLTVGGTISAARNIISNTFGNVFLGGPLTGTLVQGNYIGTNKTGDAIVGPGQYGVLIEDSSSNTIGGTTPSARNVIGGQDAWGVHVDSVTTPVTANFIQGNYIGVSSNGLTTIPNSTGVLIDGGPNNIVGAFVASGGNVISGNSFDGVWLTGSGGNDLYANKIGTDAGGSFAVPNDAGVEIADSPDNRIGGATMTAANLISGNNYGVEIHGTASTGNLVEVNLIGTTLLGDAALPNAIIGVYVNAPGNMIGVKQGQGNIIAGSMHGIRIAGSIAAGNLVQGNRIGTDPTGAIARPNQTGVRLSSGAHDNIVGGLLAESGNLISGNTDQGVQIALGAENNIIRGNLIGTALAGDTALPNGTGVDVDAASSGNRIGSASIDERNVISGNLGNGIFLHGYTSYVIGNFIGTTADAHAALGNGANGVLIDAPPSPVPPEWNLVGLDATNDPDQANRIAANAGAGVMVVSGDLVQIRGNIMFANGGLGIDLGGDGVTMNDPHDTDTGPNGRQNFPDITSATTTGGFTNIAGTLRSLSDTSFTIDFYSSPTCDPSGHGEGRTHLGHQTVATEPSGETSFLFGAPTVASGDFVTATATKGSAGTSEFSACIAAATGPPPAVSGLAFDTQGGEGLHWDPVPDAFQYHLYAGTRSTLPGLASQAADSCEALVLPDPGFAIPPASDPAPGEMLWVLVTAEGPYGEGPVQDASFGPRILTSTGACGDSCAHDICATGGPLVPACAPCASIVCDKDPACCASSWDATCVNEVRTICRNLLCPSSQGQCAHTLCDRGAPLAPGCDAPPLPVSCTAAICQSDPHCCQQAWDDACLAKVSKVCGYNCL